MSEVAFATAVLSVSFLPQSNPWPLSIPPKCLATVQTDSRGVRRKTFLTLSA